MSGKKKRIKIRALNVYVRKRPKSKVFTWSPFFFSPSPSFPSFSSSFSTRAFCKWQIRNQSTSHKLKLKSFFSIDLVLPDVLLLLDPVLWPSLLAHKPGFLLSYFIVSNRFTLSFISPPCTPPHQRRHGQEQDRCDREHLPPLHPGRLRHNPGLLVGPGHHAAAAAARAGLMFKTHDMTQEEANCVCLF